MPTPIAHSLASIILHKGNPFGPQKIGYGSILVSIIVGNLPDVDFLPGLIIGDPNRFHHTSSHSLGAALIVGLIFAAYIYHKKRRFWVPFIFVSGIYFLHVLMDYLAVDTSSPRGVPLIWPISTDYYISPVAVFSDLHKSSSSSTFFQSLFVEHNAWTVLRELILLFPIAFMVRAVRLKSNRRLSVRAMGARTPSD